MADATDTWEMITESFAEFARMYIAKGFTLKQAQEALIETSPGFATDKIFQDMFPTIYRVEIRKKTLSS